jgi:hypothetical protein
VVSLNTLKGGKMNNRGMILVIFLIFAASAVAYGASEHEKTSITKISPSDVYEKCLKLKPGQTLNYSFESSKPLAFNLHYHLLNETVFHVKENTAARKEVFHPVENQNVYCMEWRNRHSNIVTLGYGYTIIKK